MSLPPFLRTVGPAVHLTVRLQPRASRAGIEGTTGEALKVKVTAPPVEDAANRALVRLLADLLDCAPSHIRLVRGRTSRIKVLEITGPDAAAIARTLSGS